MGHGYIQIISPGSDCNGNGITINTAVEIMTRCSQWLSNMEQGYLE